VPGCANGGVRGRQRHDRVREVRNSGPHDSSNGGSVRHPLDEKGPRSVPSITRSFGPPGRTRVLWRFTVPPRIWAAPKRHSIAIPTPPPEVQNAGHRIGVGGLVTRVGPPDRIQALGIKRFEVLEGDIEPDQLAVNARPANSPFDELGRTATLIEIGIITSVSWSKRARAPNYYDEVPGMQSDIRTPIARTALALPTQTSEFS